MTACGVLLVAHHDAAVAQVPNLPPFSSDPIRVLAPEGERVQGVVPAGRTGGDLRDAAVLAFAADPVRADQQPGLLLSAVLALVEEVVEPISKLLRAVDPL